MHVIWIHFNDVIMSAMASQITSVSSVCSAVCSDANHRKHQSSASLAFVRGIDRWPVNSPHKGPVTWKTFPFGDVIMQSVPLCTSQSVLVYAKSYTTHCKPVLFHAEFSEYEICSNNHQIHRSSEFTVYKCSCIPDRKFKEILVTIYWVQLDEWAQLDRQIYPQ